jgi:ketol-acid reductoisomerase
MPLTIYHDADASLDPLADATIGVVGYGNQGHAHALNLRDAGLHVIIAQRPSPRAEAAAQAGFEVVDLPTATRHADLLIIALPDEAAADIYTAEIAPHLRAGQAVGFIHGFNIRFELIRPPADVDVIMIAPKGPGSLLRSIYLEGKGIPALLAIHQDATGNARGRALAWAKGIGCTRSGVIETTFAAETETDLFGEQAVLCGGVIELTEAAFQTLVEAGYEPMLAYLECVHELKQVVDLLYAHGRDAMRRRISNTAEFGGMLAGSKVIDEATRNRLRSLLDEIRSGKFARTWIDEYHAGLANLHEMADRDRDSSYEQAGEDVRRLMPWLGS